MPERFLIPALPLRRFLPSDARIGITMKKHPAKQFSKKQRVKDYAWQNFREMI